MEEHNNYLYHCLLQVSSFFDLSIRGLKSYNHVTQHDTTEQRDTRTSHC